MKNIVKIVIAVMLVIFSIVSVVKISNIPSEKTFAGTLAELQNKENKVMELAGASAVASAAIAAIPGDATSPIAGEIASVSSKLLAVFCAIILEKYLVSATWILSFRFLVPIVSALTILFLFLRRELILKVALKLAVFGIVIVLLIPVSMKIGVSIEENHKESYQQSVALLKTYTTQEDEKTEKAAEEANVAEADKATSGSLLDKLKGYKDELGDSVDKLVEQVRDDVSIGVETLKLAVTNLVESIAVLIVTSCVIPVLNLLILFWLIKVLFGLDVQSPINRLVGKTKNKITPGTE